MAYNNLDSANAKFVFIKVVDVIDYGDVPEPVINVRMNGYHELHKKTAQLRTGYEWYDITFKFKVQDLESDFLSVELKNRNRFVASDWIGEIQLDLSAFADGKTCESWYQFGKGHWKGRNKARVPHGYVHLHIQLMDGDKTLPPFEDESHDHKGHSFEEWKKGGMNMPGLRKEFAVTQTHQEDDEDEGTATKIYVPKFELSNALGTGMIQQTSHELSKKAHDILKVENPTDEQLKQMEEALEANCLKRSDFESRKGKLYLVGIDGSDASKAAFESMIGQIDKDKDHVMLCCIRERFHPHFGEKIAKNFTGATAGHTNIIIGFEQWVAAVRTLRPFADQCFSEGVEYTVMLPQADDARELMCALVKRYKVDVLFLGKHRGDETKHHHHRGNIPGKILRKPEHITRMFRSMVGYCQKNAKCTVVKV